VGAARRRRSRQIGPIELAATLVRSSAQRQTMASTRASCAPARSVDAAELRLQLNQIEEYVGLAAQFVGDHRRLAGNG
jgi:hypothetical protein